MTTPANNVGDRSQPVEPSDSYRERLNKLLYANLGHNWRHQISISVSAGTLSWLIYLAEVGLETKRADFASDKSIRPVEAAINLAEWRSDIEEVVMAAEEHIRRKMRPKKGK
jgi:hypothetical protein